MSITNNSTRYYISANNEKGFEEVTEAEWLVLIGDDTTCPYASKIYRGDMTIEEVPEDLQEAVQAIVGTKIARWGTYESRDIADSEALNILTGGNNK